MAILGRDVLVLSLTQMGSWLLAPLLRLVVDLEALEEEEVEVEEEMEVEEA